MSSEVIGRSTDFPPLWKSLLAVVAHPDNESFGLGAILDAFIVARTKVQVLCLTHGQTWTLQEAPGDLAALRGADLASAEDVLGPTRAKLAVNPDGALGELDRPTLVTEVVTAVESSGAEGLLVFDTAGVTGHLDHVAASETALLAAETLNVPVLGWTLSESAVAQLNQEFGVSFTDHRDEDIDLRVTLERARQRLASHAHGSHALPRSVLRRRLDLLANTGSLRWLRPPGGAVGDPASDKLGDSATDSPTDSATDPATVSHPVVQPGD